MASHYQAVPPLRYQQKIRHANDVAKISTQLSINRNDSPKTPPSPLTSAKLFTYGSNSYANTNNNGNLLFPLGKKHETFPKLATKKSWQDLLQYLKSQRIVKNMDIFKKVHKNHYEITEHHETFPWANKSSYSMTNFPCQISIQNNYDFQTSNENFQQNSTQNLKTFKLPLRQPSAGQKNRFLVKSKSIKEKSKPHKNVKLQKQKTNLKCLGSRIDFRNYGQPKELKIVRFMKELNKNFTPQIPLQNITFSFGNNKRELSRFPQTLSPTLGKFPVSKQTTNKGIQTNLIPENRIQTLKLLYNEYDVNFENKYDFKKFPCKETTSKDCDLNKFPLNVEMKNSTSIFDKSLISLTVSEPATSLAVTFKGQHVSQVQDAQIQPISTTFEHKQTPPQTIFVKTFNDDDNDLYKLPAINAINNTRSNEVGLFEEKIERIQDAIVSLFEKIQNSFRKTHIVSEHDEKTNAAINRNDDGNSNGNGVARFALTPPTNSITSVRNTERTLIKENNNDVHNKNMYNDDLGDLWHDASDQHGKIVESSDVRDTLAEAVDYGVKSKYPTTSTGSILVKSEEPIPPHTPLPQPLTDSITTSLERSDILPKYNVLPVNLVSGNDKNNFEVDISTKLNAFVTNEISTETEISVKQLSEKEESEMTITRLEDNESNCLQSRETFVEANNTLVNDIEIDEMKYEMNRTKGALPSTLTDSRAIGKHETLKTGNPNANYNRNISSNLAIRPPSRDINSSTSTQSATERLSLKSDKLHSSINTYTPLDITTNRPNLTTTTNTLNESVTCRSITPSQKSLNTSNDILANRRPSLSSLRNTQSTSLLSQDLTHYSPALTTNQKDQKTALSRGASVDSSLEGVLPERTRLRRQRRLRPQDSQDEPDDPIERLNRLKARISASLSEVKGVLKQYSTDGENENEPFNAPAAVNAKETRKEENKEEPVTFRFVKKIRRRSVFAEEEEENNQKKNTNTGIDEVDHQHRRTDENLATEEMQKLEVAQETKSDELVREKSVKRNDSDDNLNNTQNKEINTNLYTLKEEVQEPLNEAPAQFKEENKTDNKNLNVDVEKLDKPESLELRKDVSPDSKTVSKKRTIESKDALVTLESSTISIPNSLKEMPIQNNETKMGESETADVNRQSEIIKDEAKPQTLKEETRKGAIPKPTESGVSTSRSESISDSKTKNKRKVVIKPKDPSRRASLAAVEGSKIEPPVKVAMPAKIIRRPSDSEAVVKKKLITAKINTSGSIEEVTPKLKIVKVKRPSTKSNAQLATTQTKTIIEEESVMTVANNQSNDRVKSTDELKTISSDKNKDVLLPKESKNNEITSQTNLLLPTQLVIDEAASLKAKTIENSQLQSNQEQEQEQVQKQTQQQATIKSTTTKSKSNELQQTCGDGDAMLENLTTTAISSTKTTEANGQQIKRENGKAIPEDLHDLLKQETTIVKPSVTKQVEQVGEKILEKDHQKHLQQQTNLSKQQVVATTDVVVVKNDDVSNNRVNEIDETKRSSKEPCAIKSPTTSTHVVAHEHHTQPSQLVEGEQSITHKTDTKAISSPHISISSTADSIQNTTKTVDDVPLKESREGVNQNINTMPELQVAPAPVQTAEVSPQPEHNKKKIVLKKIVRQAPTDKTKKPEPDVAIAKDQIVQNSTAEIKGDISITPVPDRVLESPVKDESTEDISESTEVSESSTSQGSEEAGASNDDKPKKERKIKKKVIIKRQKRRLSIGDTFFHPTPVEEPQNAEVETLEKAIAYFTDDDDDDNDDGKNDEADSEIATEEDEETKKKALEEEEKQKKPLKSCIMHKEYNIGDEVLYAERFKKTQIKWRRGRIKERITSISYLLDIDGKDVSSHVNYLKKFTGRKVSFGGKEYLEIDYEQLAEEEEKAEKLQRRSYSIWNMV